MAKTPSTHAIFVDAGYLYAAAGRLVAGTEDRRSFDLDASGLIDALIDRARTVFADSRLLRVYWYDGARRRIHTAEQQSIAELPDVKVRLGNLNANNQQKGVDSLIRTDLESLARHRAISDAALERLRRHSWPGNVRELENAVKRALVLGSSALLVPEDFSFVSEPEARPAAATLTDLVRREAERELDGEEGLIYHRIIERVERPLIEAALARTDGNQIRAAALLGINRNTLRKKIVDLAIALPGRE